MADDVPGGETPTLLTVGHGTASADELAALLTGASVDRLVDVRRFPASRAHPHVQREALATWLPPRGIAYRWEPRLGGRRRLPRDAAAVDAWWTVEAFRAYAAHTRTDEFGGALDELVQELRAGARDGSDAAGRVAVMCSESVWWRCHRRIVADVLALTRGCDVRHLMHDGRLVPHRPAAGARPDGRGGLVWDGGRECGAS